MSILLLSEDLLVCVLEAGFLLDPLRPSLACRIAFIAKAVKNSCAILENLKIRHDEAKHLAIMWTGGGCSWMKACAKLPVKSSSNFTFRHWSTLGSLVRCAALTRLKELNLYASNDDSSLLSGISTFANELSFGCLPALTFLTLHSPLRADCIAALLSGLTRQSTPVLETLRLMQTSSCTPEELRGAIGSLPLQQTTKMLWSRSILTLMFPRSTLSLDTHQ